MINFSSWMNKTVLAAIITNVSFVDGQSVFVIMGKETYPIRQNLAQLGFIWNDIKKYWSRNLNSLLNDLNSIEKLKSLGINVPQNKPINTPVNQQPKPNNWLTRSGVVWFLSKRKQDGELIAVSKSGNDWQWIDANNNQGVYPNEGIATIIESIRGADGKPISSSSPEELLKSQIKEENPTGIKGRIPPEKLSVFQKEIENSFVDTQKNIMTNALAGTGKTTTLRHLASFKNPGEKWLYLVFNKKNQVEGKEKFPRDVEVLTSHAFLGRVLNKSSEMGLVPQTDIWTAGERISELLDKQMEYDTTFPPQLRFSAKLVIMQLSNLAKAYAINPSSSNAPQEIADIIKKFQIDCDLSTDKFQSNQDFTQDIIEKTLDVMHASLPGNSGIPELENFRDHNDTLWYCALNPDIKWPKYDVVLADEVQDFNKCQMIMLTKLAEAGARLVCVGDPNQALYLFRGADANAFQNISSMLNTGQNGAAQHSLPTNYRSGKAIINYVNQHTSVKNLQAGLQHEGLVTENIEYDNAIDKLAMEWKQNGKLKEQTAFIGRTNKPLVETALDLMKNDLDFVIIGRDFSSELVKHLQQVTGKGRNQKIIPIHQLESALNDYVSVLENKWRGKISKAPKLKQIKETTESLTNVVRYLSLNNFKDARLNMYVKNSLEFVEYLKRRFGGIDTDSESGSNELKMKDPKSFVTISTAHRSKGLEFGRVFIVHNELFPHPNAKTPEELVQEDNCYYVALTRAMNELHVLVHPQKQAVQT